ncbi:hypothetical protein F511_33284 [Dorcoceras hygrometricum]|uniref:Uncharacterized protein n=1 Tax=Dorcoceras hygrometricum TaxID=472368 RepID=A0A2Z7CL66_9LAMI|nr:hypothetical protein F511_33284 [Dorcoceras hygrometricum]
MASRHLASTNFTGKLALQRLNIYGLLIRSKTGISIPLPVCTRKPMKISRTESPRRYGQNNYGGRRRAAAARRGEEGRKNLLNSFCIGYPRTRASGESSTTKHRLLHASGPHRTSPPDDPN